MNATLRLWMILWLSLALVSPAIVRDVKSEDRYQVGVASVDITPEYPIRLNGFGGRREEAIEVRQRLWAKAMSIGVGEDPPLVLIAIDNLGIRLDMVDRVARQLEQSHEIPRANIALTFSHTHCGPKVNGASDNIFSSPIPRKHQVHIDRYTEELESSLVAVARQALDSGQPCRLERATGRVTFAVNRRTPGGPVDHDLPVLVARDNDDQIVAIYTSYACHCVALSENKLSGDWAGYAQEFIEREFPGSTALISIGAGSDSNPDRRQSDDTADTAISLGMEIATEVKRLMDEPWVPVRGELSAELNRIHLPLNPLPTRQQLQDTVAAGGSAGYNAQTQLDRMDAGQPLLRSVEYPIQNWRWGDDFAMVFLAGEVCVDYSLRLKRELNRDRLWINAYSNDFGCYIPSERLLREGGYGGGSEIPYFALPTTLKSGLEQQIIDEVHRQLPGSFQLPPGTKGIPPKSADQSLSTIETHERFSVELVATEPLVADPVAIDFGPDGRLWVVEMPDYNHKVDAQIKPSGRVKFLQDDDDDGRMDRATVFADGFLFPMDVKCWRDGVLVCDAPNIYFLRDIDGDGAADDRTIWFSGFETHNPHGRVNGLRWGVDGWVYGSCGLFGGKITSYTGHDLNLGARDFRIQPDKGIIEPATGRSQQGRVTDDWGNWFGCDNSTLLWHYPLSAENVARAQGFAPPTTTLRVIQQQTLYPPPDIVTYTLSGTPGVPTSACGLEIYRDHLLGDNLHGNSFTAEPVHQLIHRRRLTDEQHSYRADRAEEELESEFLVSTDQWFRPVQVRTGPDGALWVVDMYRFVIEHQRWISADDQKELDLFAGQPFGRIYRVVPVDGQLHPVPRFDRLPIGELVERLDHANGVQRDLAHQQLAWRGNRKAVALLSEFITDSSHPAGQIHAMHLLHHWESLTPEILGRAFTDDHPAVRRHAVLLSEPFLDQNEDLRHSVTRLTADADFKVSLQAVFSLGKVSNQRTAVPLLNRVVESRNPYMTYAAMCGIGPHNLRSGLELVFSDRADDFRSVQMQLIQMAFTLNDRESISLVMNEILGQPSSPRNWQMDSLAWASTNHPARIEQWANRYQQQSNPMDAFLVSSRAVVFNKDEDVSKRVAAIKLMASRPLATDDLADAFETLMDPAEGPAIQTAAIDLIADPKSDEVVDLLIARIPISTPTVSQAIVSRLMERNDWARKLVVACQENRSLINRILPEHRQRLVAHDDAGIKQLALDVFEIAATSDKSGLLEAYAEAAQLTGNPGHGKALFAEHCGRCHQTSAGSTVGPDLAALTNRDRYWLLETILDPNRNIDGRYLNYIVQLVDGRTVTGLVSEETSSHLTLYQSDGHSLTIARDQIDVLKSSEVSFMPEGLERDIDVQGMADIIEYLVSFNRPAKSLRGNQPALVEADDQDNLVLSAAAASIFGADITFEELYQNIGYWHDETDHAVWTVRVERPGIYEVLLDYSCPENSAGNRFRIDGLSDRITAVVKPTGGWDQYNTISLGERELLPGTRQVILSPDGPVNSYLLDLREIRLVPLQR